MLLSNIRHILHFDLAMVPYPEDADAIPLQDVAGQLVKRSDSHTAFETIDNERRVIRLANAETIKANGETDKLAMLLTLGDKDKAFPGFTDFETGDVRVVRPEASEGGALSVHALLDLSPTKKGGYTYEMVYEDVTGFGRSIIQRFLRNQFKIICKDGGFIFDRPGRKAVQTRPMVELNGHASNELKTSLKNGRLLYVELTDYVQDDLGFDDSKFVKRARRSFNISVSKDLPEGDGLDFIEKVKVWAKRAGYDQMRVRWREEGKRKDQSASLSTKQKDAGEALFVRNSEIKLTAALPDVSAKLSKEMIDKMRKVMAQ